MVDVRVGKTPSQPRYRFVSLMLVITLLVGGLGFFAGSRMQNAADAASERTAPSASPITVSVEQRELRSTIIARGVAEYPSMIEITLGGLVGGDGERQVVTVSSQQGTTIGDGDLLGQVSGRPIIALEGDQPSFRTLRIGSVGADVNQLELALSRFGFDPGEIDQEFTRSTALAVAQWYESLGFPAEGQTRWTTRHVAVPAGEIVFIPSLPGVVDDVLAPAGTTVTGPILQLTSGALQVRFEANEADRELITRGLPALLEIGDTTLDGTVTDIDPQRDGPLSVVLETTEPLAGELASSSVKITISLAASDGAVLAVPIAAVSTASDGTQRISLLTESSQAVDVEVQTGISADGYVELLPTESDIEAGDLLVIGWQ